MPPLQLVAALLLALPTSEPLAGWQDAKIAPLLPGAECHSIHTYYVTSPESPDGRYVLFYASTDPRGDVGEIRIVERATGVEKTLARNVTVEDAHRAACQQWVSGGRRVVFHDVRDGHWLVACVDIATGKEEVIARDRQIGFGEPTADLVPVYSPHWNPGAHRDLEIVDLKTGQTRTPVTADAVKAAYPDWIAQKFGDRPVSIFFPVLGPTLDRVFFKMATPAGGDFRSSKASFRTGLVGYDLAGARFLCLRDWGHPAWHPNGRAVLDRGGRGLTLFDMVANRLEKDLATPPLPGGHPAFASDGRTFACDRHLKGSEQWDVVLGDFESGQTLVLHQFDMSRGAASWRRTNPHPAFSPDGKRLYFNVSADRWTRLYVAQRGSR